MKKLRTYSYIAIAAQVLSTGLAWVMNGDVISSIVISVLIPLSLAALALAARAVIASQSVRSLLRIEAVLIFFLSAAALILAIFTDKTTAPGQPSMAPEAIIVAGMVSALALLTMIYGLRTDGLLSIAITIVGIIAASGIVMANIDSIDLMVIAASRAAMILFLVLLSQSLDPTYATS